MILPNIQIQDINDTPKHTNFWSIIYVLYLYVWSIIYVLYFYVWEYHLYFVFVCLGVSFMSCICMFGCIIYILYLYSWVYHLCLVFVCLEYHVCLVFVCLGVSFVLYLYVWEYHLCLHPNIQIQDINDTPNI
jgi:hypothetical protein